MECLVPEQTLWRSDRWIPRQWTRKSGITFDLLSAVIENRVRRLRRQASRSTRATGRPSSKSTLTAKSYRSMPSAMSTVLPVQIRTGWIMKPRDFAAREDEAANGVCNARSAFEPLPKVDCAKFVFVSSLQADRRIAASRPRESFARQAESFRLRRDCSWSVIVSAAWAFLPPFYSRPRISMRNGCSVPV